MPTLSTVRVLQYKKQSRSTPQEFDVESDIVIAFVTWPTQPLSDTTTPATSPTLLHVLGKEHTTLLNYLWYSVHMILYEENQRTSNLQFPMLCKICGWLSCVIPSTVCPIVDGQLGSQADNQFSLRGTIKSLVSCLLRNSEVTVTWRHILDCQVQCPQVLITLALCDCVSCFGNVHAIRKAERRDGITLHRCWIYVNSSTGTRCGYFDA